jgi:FtsP/CotA-like multicopper oxidase with cupredoxin domain
MIDFEESRRRFLKTGSVAAGSILLAPKESLARVAAAELESVAVQGEPVVADHTLHIRESPGESAPKRIISATTYNGQFPGPLLRFKEGQEITVDIFNDSDTPEQLHWHGQKISTDVDGAAEEGTPFIPAHGKRRITFTPNPSGLRFYHTLNRAGANLYAGQYSGEVGPVYIEPRHNPDGYDREVLLVLKEFG